jgi:2',3'-cyclic-nucleotide 2'-phosphodiesterase (5'-nucleotidase family)
VEISIKNGGGIRREIGFISVPAGSTDPPELLPPQANAVAGKQEHEVSQLDIEATLAFNNGLTLLTVSAEELRVLLEHAVSGVAPGSTPGAFPQVGGLRFSFDPAGTAQVIDGMTGTITTAGERIQNVAVLDGTGDCVRVLVEDGVFTPGQEVRMVVLDFLAGGGDGYPLSMLAAPMRVDLESDVDFSVFPWTAAEFAPPGTEQDALAELLSANTSLASPYARAETPPETDARIQNLSVRADTVLDGCP